MLHVLIVLKKEGIDVERIFTDVVNGKEEIEGEQSLRQFIEDVDNYEKEIYKKYKDFNNKDSFDADDSGTFNFNSVLSSMQDLSFHRDNLTEEDWAYSTRNQYVCKHELSKELQEKLKLNFNVLYDEQS